MSYNLVWFSEIKWDYLRTRKQQILSRFGPEWRILFIEPYKSGVKQNWIPRQYGNLWVVTIPMLKSPPESREGGLLASPVFQAINQTCCWLLFKAWSLVHGFHKADRIIGLSNIYWGKLAIRQEASCHFYDANDAHLDFPNVPSWAAEFIEPYVEGADLVFSVSPEISLQVEAMGGDTPVLLGNGVEYEHFAEEKDPIADIRPETGRLLGYAGAMDWLDPDLLFEIASTFSDDQIVLLGPCINPNWWERQKRLQAAPNLSYLGRIDYSDLPGYVQQFDVCMIPFLKNELTKPLNPNKLYEYCATGSPVVSMDYSSTIAGLRDIIDVASSPAEFLEKLAAATAEGAEKRKALARENSWDSISERMQSELISLVSEKD